MLEQRLDSALRGQITDGSISVTFPSGQTRAYGNGADPGISISIRDTGALRAIALDPTLAVPEMYMEGRLTIERGDPYDLIALFKSNTAPERATAGAVIGDTVRAVLRAPKAHGITLGAARANVAHHYDLSEELYRLFLDDDMQYSCAFFEREDMSLDEAQLAKKRLIAAKMLVEPGARVLDIGCGWGGMALYLARVCDARVTGITLSQEQLRVATARAEALGLSDRVSFELRDYREMVGEFDNIVSVGMFEHVGQRQFPVFFETASRLLAPEGTMLLHAIGQPTPPRYNQPFIEKYIFPGGHIPALSQVLPFVEKAGLLLRDIEILTLHYAKTLAAWRERFNAARDKVLALYDERFIRMWDFYLAGSEASFRHDNFHVFHLQLVRDQERIPLTRAYIPRELARLRGIEAGIPDYAALHSGAGLAEVPGRMRETG
ncbi:SAM-dependent methyltransferase [Amaricoccus solimangrovi]|uniref:Class I SAM-dependent methyltransferase n=1 Tax=Amaricoccus solimangrovi TaxID=2589815 RepID=A0A501WQ74_9RHOB|nr:cyclopropane-fatty-acyl-phospholipid synthase family protein [Amaricoccus solimangrovi]TPE51498.1 class I SAM-dependent methyltransferase [Amaricoccus solimangrovi]